MKKFFGSLLICSLMLGNMAYAVKDKKEKKDKRSSWEKLSDELKKLELSASFTLIDVEKAMDNAPMRLQLKPQVKIEPDSKTNSLLVSAQYDLKFSFSWLDIFNLSAPFRGFNIGSSDTASLYFAKFYKDTDSAFKALKHIHEDFLNPIRKFPLNAQAIIENMEDGDLYSIPIKLNTAIGWGKSEVKEGDHYDAKNGANVGYVGSSNFVLQVFRADIKHVRVRLIASSNRSFNAGFGIDLAFTNDKVLEKLYDSEILDLSLSKNIKGQRFVLDYVFDLTNPLAVDALNSMLSKENAASQKLKVYLEKVDEKTGHTISDSWFVSKVLNPFVDTIQIFVVASKAVLSKKYIMEKASNLLSTVTGVTDNKVSDKLTTIQSIEDVIEYTSAEMADDLAKGKNPGCGQCVTQMFKAESHRLDKNYNGGIGGGLVIAAYETSGSTSAYAIQSHDKDNKITDFAYSLDGDSSESKLGRHLIHYKEIINTSFYPLYQLNSKLDSVVTKSLGFNYVRKDPFFSRTEQDIASHLLESQLPNSLLKSANVYDSKKWSNTKKVKKDARVNATVIINNSGMGELKEYTQSIGFTEFQKSFKEYKNRYVNNQSLKTVPKFFTQTLTQRWRKAKQFLVSKIDGSHTLDGYIYYCLLNDCMGVTGWKKIAKGDYTRAQFASMGWSELSDAYPEFNEYGMGFLLSLLEKSIQQKNGVNITNEKVIEDIKKHLYFNLNFGADNAEQISKEFGIIENKEIHDQFNSTRGALYRDVYNIGIFIDYKNSLSANP